MFEMTDEKRHETLNALDMLHRNIADLKEASDNRSSYILALEADNERLKARIAELETGSK